MSGLSAVPLDRTLASALQRRSEVAYEDKAFRLYDATN